MQLLLDTHVFLWAAANPDTLRREVRAAIEDSSNTVFVSAGVAWEIGIKVALGKLTVPGDPLVWLPARLRSMGFHALDITVEHALAAAGLPEIHRDPFDRIMIAQAHIEGLTLVTRDPEIQKYSIPLMQA